MGGDASRPSRCHHICPLPLCQATSLARRRTRRASTETAAPTDTSSYVITITPEAQDHIAKLRAAEGPGTHLRMGVKAGAAAV